MQLARFLNSVFKKDGFILVDANSKNYIIWNPKNDIIYKNVLPPLSILNSKEEKELIDNLERLNFSINSAMVAWNAIS